MLERHDDDILHTFERRRAVRSRKALGDYNPDSTKGVSSIPVALLQDLPMERGKAKGVLIAIPIDIGTELYQGS